MKLENKVGTMLPFNVVMQQLDTGEIEVAAIDPVASMQAIQYSNLNEAAALVREKQSQVNTGLSA